MVLYYMANAASGHDKLLILLCDWLEWGLLARSGLPAVLQV